MHPSLNMSFPRVSTDAPGQETNQAVCVLHFIPRIQGKVDGTRAGKSLSSPLGVSCVPVTIQQCEANEKRSVMFSNPSIVATKTSSKNIFEVKKKTIKSIDILPVILRIQGIFLGSGFQ